MVVIFNILINEMIVNAIISYTGGGALPYIQLYAYIRAVNNKVNIMANISRHGKNMIPI